MPTSWTGPERVQPDTRRDRRRPEPLPTFYGQVGLDLRGMGPARQATYLLTGMVEFDRMVPLEGEWPAPRRRGAFRLLYVLALPKRYRPHVLIPHLLMSQSAVVAE
ncbi:MULTISPECIES: hypothetical protein [unclassified Saccharothrix]|uniref:hypothetical protein n=1 Tax=unclassified Saccharothrix TaxID=2593673 RepID=UPI00307EA55B